MYTTIICDFFGVFCPDITQEWFKKIVPDDAAKFAQYRALCTESDYGRLRRDDFTTKMAALTGVAPEEVVRGIEAETVMDTTVVDYIRSLKAAGYRIAALSNGTHEWTTRTITEHGLADLFKLTVISGDLGIVKPDPAIFQVTLSKLAIPAEQAVFIDDRPINVEGAKACGIKGFVFTDTDALIQDLTAVGINP